MRKERIPNPDPYLWLLDPDVDREAQKQADPADQDPDSHLLQKGRQ
jgi:hypothetical protein